MLWPFSFAGSSALDTSYKRTLVRCPRPLRLFKFVCGFSLFSFPVVRPSLCDLFSIFLSGAMGDRDRCHASGAYCRRRYGGVIVSHYSILVRPFSGSGKVGKV